MEDEPKSAKSAWLTELESKSWSLEMTISGAATFAVSYLPGMLDSSLDYYFEHLAPSTSKLDTILPILSYSFFMVVSWVLFGFFVLHLCMRALWVGAVGLHAAFPQGINFDNLPNASVFYKALVKERFGSLEQYIFRLDKRSNKMFALAFMLAMSIGGVGILYMLIFSIMLLLRNSVEAATLETIGNGIYFMVMLLAISTLLSNWWIKRHPNQVRLGKFMAKVQLAFGNITNPIFSKSMQYLSLAFMTNLSRKTFYTGLTLIIVLMMVSTIFVTLRRSMAHYGQEPLFGRSYFSTGSNTFRLSADAYDAQRDASAPLPNICIPDDIVEQAYLPVFVKYPRALDARLAKFCGNPVINADTVLSKSDRRRMADSLNIKCLGNFFQLRLNDSIRLNSDWLFTEKNGSKGIVGYLETKQFPTGKNKLSVDIPVEGNPDSLEQWGSLYFWLAPK